jgi:cardiolipin synthase
MTAFRVVLLPFFVYLILQPSRTSHLIAFAIFLFASLTDLLDGYLARRLNQQTELGKFLDPLADKFLVLGAFVTLIFLSEQIPVWMVLCIVGRDVLITFFRYLAIYQGSSLRTSRLAKAKTAFQMFSIFVILTSLALITVRQRDLINQSYREAAGAGYTLWEVATANLRTFLEGRADGVLFALASFLPYFLMAATTAVTIISLMRYVATNFRLLRGPIPLIRPREADLPIGNVCKGSGPT